MADINVKNQQGQGGKSETPSSNQGTPARQRGAGLSSSRVDLGFPSLFSASPGELLSLRPFALMQLMSEEMDRMSRSAGMPQRAAETSSLSSSFTPPIEISQSENELHVCAELPGLKPEEVTVEATEEGLVIQGERRREQRQEQQGGYFRTERSYGRFYRTIPLPEEADLENARAEFTNGELRVTIPMPERRSRNRQIQVTTGQSGASSSVVSAADAAVQSGKQGQSGGSQQPVTSNPDRK